MTTRTPRDYSHSAHPRACVELEQAGIDPFTTSAEEITTDGYMEFVVDKDGKRILNPLTLGYAKRFVKWPSKAVGKRVLKALAADQVGAA